MTLENLLKTGQLKRHDASADEIRRLFDAAKRSLKDAGAANISPESRFDLAYKAIMQLSLAALIICGFRPDTNRPGHHALVIQSLPKTMGLSAGQVAVLDTFRRKRNLADYTGDDVDDISAEQCRQAARALLEQATAWLARVRPDFAAASEGD